MTVLRVGILGLGVGEQHAIAYHRHHQCRVAALCDLSEEKMLQVQKKIPEVALLTTNADDIITNPDIDAISIATYDDVHADQVIHALDAGKHVFVEKPLCQNLEQALQIKKVWLSKKKEQKIGCNLILREAPLYKWIRDAINKNQLGEIYAFDGEYLYGRLHKITDEWRSKVDNYSVMEGGGIHMIDLLLWLTGERPVSVMASGNRICTKKTAFRYNDYITSIFEFQNGMIGRITANFGCIHRHQHVVRIYGTKATILYDDAGPRMYRTRDPSESPTLISANPLPTTKGDLIPSFISSILTKKDITDETQMLFDGISICSACDRSVQTKTRELIHYL